MIPVQRASMFKVNKHKGNIALGKLFISVRAKRGCKLTWSISSLMWSSNRKLSPILDLNSVAC